MNRTVRLIGLSILLCCGFASEAATESNYVGSMACHECHAEIYDTFMASARKAHSYSSIERMTVQLTDEDVRACYACHTTGYGKGGFENVEKTPELRNTGCEVCHGPGREHIESGGDPQVIQGKGDLNVEKTCLPCHDEKRVQTFGYKPVLHAGAH